MGIGGRGEKKLRGGLREGGECEDWERRKGEHRRGCKLGRVAEKVGGLK